MLKRKYTKIGLVALLALSVVACESEEEKRARELKELQAKQVQLQQQQQQLTQQQMAVEQQAQDLQLQQQQTAALNQQQLDQQQLVVDPGPLVQPQYAPPMGYAAPVAPAPVIVQSAPAHSGSSGVGDFIAGAATGALAHSLLSNNNGNSNFGGGYGRDSGKTVVNKTVIVNNHATPATKPAPVARPNLSSRYSTLPTYRPAPAPVTRSNFSSSRPSSYGSSRSSFGGSRSSGSRSRR